MIWTLGCTLSDAKDPLKDSRNSEDQVWQELFTEMFFEVADKSRLKVQRKQMLHSFALWSALYTCWS
jgi:hypothetical protein